MATSIAKKTAPSNVRANVVINLIRTLTMTIHHLPLCHPRIGRSSFWSLYLGKYLCLLLLDFSQNLYPQCCDPRMFESSRRPEEILSLGSTVLFVARHHHPHQFYLHGKFGLFRPFFVGK